MKLQVLQEDLTKALTKASRFTSSRAQLPVLGNILLSCKKNKLVVSATNLETSISLSIGAQVKKEGEITAPAKTITDIVSNLPSGVLTLEVVKERIILSTKNFRSEISGMNSSDFPAIPHSLEKGMAVLEKDSFTKALSQVLFAVSIDETRPILTGVLFIQKKNSLTLVATDGFRLSQKKIPAKVKLDNQSLILPKTVLMEILRLASGEEIEFVFKKSENQVVFKVNDTVLASRVLEGSFPNFEKIIPKESKIKVILDKTEMLRAVKLAAVFARESANIVKLNIKKGLVNFFAESQGSGSQQTSVDAQVEGDIGEKGFEIAFNYRFLEDVLNAIEGEEIQIEVSDSNAPGTFTDPTDPNFLHLIMPVRLQG